MKLWKEAYYPADIFEKRLTEFHLVEDRDRKQILAAIGIHPENNGVMIHSETFGDPNNQDLYRDMLWPRFQTLARNLGVAKIWTQETASFWNRAGFKRVSENVLEKRPNFPDSEEQLHWTVFELFDEEEVEKALKNAQYDQLLKVQEDEAEAFNKQLKILKNVVIVLGISIIGTLLIMFLYSFASSFAGVGR